MSFHRKYNSFFLILCGLFISTLTLSSFAGEIKDGGLNIQVNLYPEALSDTNKEFLKSDKMRDTLNDLFTNGEDSFQVLSDNLSHYLLVKPGRKALNEGKKKKQHSKLMKFAILPVSVPLYSHLIIGVYLLRGTHYFVGKPLKDVSSIPSRRISHRYHRGVLFIHELQNETYGPLSKLVMKDFLNLVPNREMRRNLDEEKINELVFSQLNIQWSVDDGPLRFKIIRQRLKEQMIKALSENPDILERLL